MPAIILLLLFAGVYMGYIPVDYFNWSYNNEFCGLNVSARRSVVESVPVESESVSVDTDDIKGWSSGWK